MNCPFCNSELVPAFMSSSQLKHLWDGEKCKYKDAYLPIELWQKLADNEKTQEMLEYCKTNLNDIKNILNRGRYGDTMNFSLDNVEARMIYEDVVACLNEITQTVEQDNKEKQLQEENKKLKHENVRLQRELENAIISGAGGDIPNNYTFIKYDELVELKQKNETLEKEIERLLAEK